MPAVLLSGKPCLSMSEESEACWNYLQDHVDLFDCEDIVHQECVPLGQMVKQNYYQEVLLFLEGTRPSNLSCLNIGASRHHIVHATVFGC
jgi:hypothetical protein